jgi:hypothetical protein
MIESRSDSADRLPDAFRLTKRKGPRTIIATCAAYSNPVGWDLELSIEGETLIESGPMRSAAQMMRTIDEVYSEVETIMRDRQTPAGNWQLVEKGKAKGAWAKRLNALGGMRPTPRVEMFV